MCQLFLASSKITTSQDSTTQKVNAIKKNNNHKTSSIVVVSKCQASNKYTITQHNLSNIYINTICYMHHHHHHIYTHIKLFNLKKEKKKKKACQVSTICCILTSVRPNMNQTMSITCINGVVFFIIVKSCHFFKCPCNFPPFIFIFFI